MSFPPSFLEELRARLPLSDIVGSRMKLTRAGREHKGCCPFHNEKTPSFTVNDTKGFFHCFGCGAHGDIVGFVMQHDRLSFPEAVELLARQAGLEVPRLSPEEVKKEDKRKTLHELCEAACRWFEQQLRTPQGREAREYLLRRGVRDETMQRFRLGYAPLDGAALVTMLKNQGFDDEQMIEAGLVRKSDRDGSLYSFFRDRVLFPVTDRRGRVVAFGGRIMAGEGPKYINSPDHPLFHKGKLLYSLARAREAAHKGALVVVVEGYMDVIAMVEAGFSAAVAPLGTALTEDQMEELWKLGSPAGDPILCFDGDTAGQRAAARALERALPRLGAGRTFRFAFLPQGQDPDDLIKAEGKKAMQGVLDAAIPLVDMLWRLGTAAHPADTPESRAAVRSGLISRISCISDATVRDYYTAEFDIRLDRAYGRGRVRQERNQKYAPYYKKNAKVSSSVLSAPPDPRTVWQRQIITGILRQPAAFEALCEPLLRLDLHGPLDKLWQAVVSTVENRPSLDSSGLVACLCAQGHEEQVEALLNNRSEVQRWLRDGATLEAVQGGLQEIIFRYHAQSVKASMRAAGRTYEQELSDGARARIEAMRAEYMSTSAGEDEDGI